MTGSITHRRLETAASFDGLAAAIAFEQRSVRVFGTSHPQPRLTKWYGPTRYAYSGLTWEAAELPAAVEALRQAVEAATGGRFNSVLCNLYRDGRDTVGWHSDDEALFGRDPEVASLSFGGARVFNMRHKSTGERRSFTLANGDLLYMGRGVQAAWQHSLPRTAKPVEPRINLTFRNAVF